MKKRRKKIETFFWFPFFQLLAMPFILKFSLHLNFVFPFYVSIFQANFFRTQLNHSGQVRHFEPIFKKKQPKIPTFTI